MATVHPGPTCDHGTAPIGDSAPRAASVVAGVVAVADAAVLPGALGAGAGPVEGEHPATIAATSATTHT